MSSILSALPQIVSIGCRICPGGEETGWRTHPYDELCLVSQGTTTVGLAGRRVKAQAGSLLLVRRGEEHGIWNKGEEAPDLWVIHCLVPDEIYALLPDLAEPVMSRRLWRLGPAEQQEFRALFVSMTMESARSAPEAPLVCSAWLQLLLGLLHRWRSSRESRSLALNEPDDDVIALWETLNSLVDVPFSEMERLPELAVNYDSLRHRFRRAYGLSPRAMLQNLRLQRAQHLLLDGDMSVKEVAEAVGYWRQHEFARAFRRTFGMSPREWKAWPKDRRPIDAPVSLSAGQAAE